MVGDSRIKTDPATGVKLVKPCRGPDPPLAAKLVSAGTAACIADFMTFPLDTAKVRLQIQGEKNTPKVSRSRLQAHKPKSKYRGVFGTLRVIAQEEGVKGLYNGIVPGLQRQLCFSVVRLGCYDEVKKIYMKLFYKESKAKDMTIGVRVISGITTGALSVCLAQPTDVVKVRMQAQSGAGTRLYTGTLQAYKTIAVNEGFRGLWKGCIPNVTRNAIVTVGELVTYDVIKDSLITRNILSDGIPCHLISAFGAGFCATIVASPVDVVKTRFMNSTQGQYSGALQCALSVFREGGARAFYKGFVPSLTRLGTWNVIMFVCYEQLKLALSPKPILRTINLPS